MTNTNESHDYALRITAANGMIRAFFADTKRTVNAAAAIHGTTPVMTAALGRLLTAGAIMGLTLKDSGDLLTLTVKGDGLAGGLLVTADHLGRVKGYCSNPLADIPLKANGKLDVSGVIGKGTLTLVKDMGFKEPYNGTVALQTGEIAEDIAFYYAQSEQTPTAVSLGVLIDVDYSVKQAGGFVIQLMPGASNSVVDHLEQTLERLDSLTSLYENGHTPESLANTLLSELGYEITDKIKLRYFCDCSREKVEKALISLGKDELGKIIEEDKSASVNCHFCNKEYLFSEVELRGLDEML